jgi:hypothetical protein
MELGLASVSGFCNLSSKTPATPGNDANVEICVSGTISDMPFTTAWYWCTIRAVGIAPRSRDATALVMVTLDFGTLILGVGDWELTRFVGAS